jgi:hypothetical protein
MALELSRESRLTMSRRHGDLSQLSPGVIDEADAPVRNLGHLSDAFSAFAARNVGRALWTRASKKGRQLLDTPYDPAVRGCRGGI